MGHPAAGKRIVLATFGSLGDLHPFLALARGLKSRGHEPVVATSDVHRGRVERLGLSFHAVRPEVAEMENDPEFFRRAMDLYGGPAFVIRDVLMPHVRAGFEDLSEAVAGADLLVSHTIVYAAPVVAEATGVPWLSVAIAPILFMSKYDPPVLSPAVWLKHLRPLGPRFWGPLLGLGKWTARSWSVEVRRLRRELGLPTTADPVFEGSFSPAGVLCVFSKAFGEPQPDWPPNAVVTGFAFFDTPEGEGQGLGADLRRFLDAGTPPIIFTLGSSAVKTAGSFYEESLAAAAALGRRALLLIGEDPRNRPTEPLPDWAFAVDYAPHSQVFPRGAALVHQGGVGTTGQALRSGVPMLVVPWSHDQPDNADRIVRLGVGRTLSRARYTARTAAHALGRLLGDPSYAARASEVGRLVRSEDGVATACDVIEAEIARRAGAYPSPGVAHVED